jgi:GNAT superfamily N-acetyltransferase
VDDLQVRSARASDAATIIDFQLAMAWETEQLKLEQSTCDAGVRAVIADPALGRYFVAERAGIVVGSLLITYEWSDWRNGQIWWLQSVYVRPESRGRGVFRELYRHVHQIVDRDDSIRGLRLYVERQNESAQQVYRRLGMDGDRYQVFESLKGAAQTGPSH